MVCIHRGKKAGNSREITHCSSSVQSFTVAVLAVSGPVLSASTEIWPAIAIRYHCPLLSAAPTDLPVRRLHRQMLLNLQGLFSLR